MVQLSKMLKIRKNIIHLILKPTIERDLLTFCKIDQNKLEIALQQYLYIFCLLYKANKMSQGNDTDIKEKL